MTNITNINKDSHTTYNKNNKYGSSNNVELAKINHNNDNKKLDQPHSHRNINYFNPGLLNNHIRKITFNYNHA